MMLSFRFHNICCAITAALLMSACPFEVREKPFQIVQIAGIPASDARFDRRVTVRVTGDGLAEFLDGLSQNGVKFTASASCSRTKVQLRISNKPLRIILQALAD